MDEEIKELLKSIKEIKEEMKELDKETLSRADLNKLLRLLNPERTKDEKLKKKLELAREAIILHFKVVPPKRMR